MRSTRPLVAATALTAATVTTLALLSAPASAAQPAADTTLIAAARQALRADNSDRDVLCSDNVPIGPHAQAAVCIGEHDNDITAGVFSVAAAIQNTSQYRFLAYFQLWFSPDDVHLGDCNNKRVNPGKIYTCSSNKHGHTYPVAGHADVGYDERNGTPFQYGHITSPSYD
jgi:hypothetical protein